MIAAPHHVVTVEQYHRMIDAGVFADGARVELVDGELLSMAPMGDRHYLAVASLNEQFVLALAGRRDLRVATQSPVTLGPADEPEPDLVVARRTAGKPTAADLLLVVEISDSTLVLDREVKLPRYARAGVPEAWLVDLVNDRVEVHTRPGPDGYGAVRTLGAQEPLAIPGTATAVDWRDALGR